MADDAVIRIVTNVDLGGVNTGLPQLQAKVKSALQNLSEAEAAFGAAAKAGNEQAIAALKGYESELASAKSALLQFTQAEQQEIGVLRGGTSARMAAAAELRVLEGNFMGSTRAAGAFLTTLPGIGAAMSAAFPIFGVVALVEILVRGVETLSKWNSALHTLSSSEQQLHDQMISHANDEFSINKQLVSSEYAIAIAQANSPIEKDRLRVQMQEAMLSLGDRHLNQLKASMQQLEVYGSAQKVVAENFKDIGKEALLSGNLSLAASSAIAAFHAQGQSQAAFTPGKDGKSEMEKTHEEMERAQAERNEIKAKGIEDEHKVDRDGIKEDKQIQAEKLREFETALDQQRALAPMGAFAERNYWQSKIGAFQQGSSEYLSVISKIATLTAEAHKQETEVVKQAQERASRDYEQSQRVMEEASKAMGKVMLDQAEDVLRTGERWKEYNNEVAKAAEIDRSNAAAIAEATIKAQEASGQITKLGADKALAAIKTQEYTDKIKALRAELDKINADPNLTEAQKATQGQGIQNQISGLQGQQAAQGITSQAQINQQIAQPYTQAFDIINQNWFSLQSKLIFGTRNIGTAFKNMGVSILSSFASTAEQYALKWAEKELLVRVLHLATNQAKVASDAAPAGESKAATSAANVASVESYAAVAAAASAASVAAIPLVGWAMAPAVAAGTFASTSAYATVAAFETGGLIPNTGIALVHQGEAVLPAHLTNFLLHSASNTNNSSSASITNNFNGGSDRMFQRQMMRNSTTVVRATQRGLRKMGGR